MNQKITQMTVENCDSQFLVTQIKQVIADEVQRAIASHLQAPKTDKLFTRVQAAEYLDRSLPTLHAWTQQGILQAYSIGGCIYYKQSDIDSALKPTKPYTNGKK